MKLNPAALLRQVKQEAAKITWPTFRQTLNMTLVVVVMCIILAVFLWGIDVTSTALVRKFVGV